MSVSAGAGPELEPTRLADAVERWRDACVWVVGDMMLDVWIRGTARRISPEAPVPVVQVASRTVSPGGAAHVARNIRALGGRPVIIGVVGEDESGRELRAGCISEAIDTTGIVGASERPTTAKYRVIAHGQQLVRYDIETSDALDSVLEAGVLAVLDACPRPDAIIVSDYAKGLVSHALMEELGRRASLYGIPLLVDPKKVELQHYSGATVITPNAREFQDAVGKDVELGSDVAVEEALSTVSDKCGIDAFVVTLGADGMAVWRRGHALERVSASARHVFDVTGAGDTVIATLALGLVGGLDLVSAAVVANRTAGLAVELPGAAVISLRDLARTFPGPELRAGAVERETLLSAVRWWRLCGRRIVFTNGCFDLLHIGHLALLRQAAAEGDVLIVGLNSDASVSRLKGPTRPIHDAHARAEVLGAIDVVDAVVVFDEDTPLELLKELRPDVLVKGADYRIEDVVGRAEVESWGGRVHLASLVPQQSTTGIVARMRGDAGETR